MKSLLAALAILFFLAAPTRAEGTLDEAIAAYDAGDYEKAYELFLPLAEAGDAEAQYKLGRMYDEGLGFDPKYSTAVEWYEKAVAQGHLRAHVHLARHLANGDGARQDFVRASALSEFAARQCDRDGAFLLGVLLLTAENPSHNDSLGIAWLFVARDLGDQDAETLIAITMYHRGTSAAIQGYSIARTLEAGMTCSFLPHASP